MSTNCKFYCHKWIKGNTVKKIGPARSRGMEMRSPFLQLTYLRDMQLTLLRKVKGPKGTSVEERSFPKNRLGKWSKRFSSHPSYCT